MFVILISSCETCIYNYLVIIIVDGGGKPAGFPPNRFTQFLSIKLQNSTTVLTITVAEVSGLRSNQKGIE